MSYYSALVTAWNLSSASSGALPTGVTGTSLFGLTTVNKLTAVNGWTVNSGTAQSITLSPSQFINICAAADVEALTSTQVALLTMILGGGAPIDASKGSTVRAVIQNIFTGKTTTLNNLAAFVAPYDNGTMPWWEATIAQSGAGLSSIVNGNDLVAAAPANGGVPLT